MTQFFGSDSLEAAGPGEAGFTLVEVLVTLALIAMLSTIMVGAIGQLAQLSAASRKNDAQVEMDALAAYLAQVITDAQALPLLDQAADERIFLQGSPTGLRFVSVARLGTNQRGLREIDISVEGETDRKTLLQETYPRRFGRSEDLRGNAVTLADDLASVNFEYREMSGTDRWSDRWVATDQLPAAIQVRISAMRHGVRIDATKAIFLNAAR